MNRVYDIRFSVYACVFERTWDTCTCLSIYVFVHACGCACIFVCVCMCVCVHTCVWHIHTCQTVNTLVVHTCLNTGDGRIQQNSLHDDRATTYTQNITNTLTPRLPHH